jgi:hypothetical protein
MLKAPSSSPTTLKVPGRQSRRHSASHFRAEFAALVTAALPAEAVGKPTRHALASRARWRGYYMSRQVAWLWLTGHCVCPAFLNLVTPMRLTDIHSPHTVAAVAPASRRLPSKFPAECDTETSTSCPAGQRAPNCQRLIKTSLKSSTRPRSAISACGLMARAEIFAACRDPHW